MWVSPGLILSCHPTFPCLPFSSLLQWMVCSHPGVSAPLKSQHLQAQFFLAVETAQWTEFAVTGESPHSVLIPTGPAATCGCGQLHWLTAEGLPSMHKAVGLIPALLKLGVVTYSGNLSTGGGGRRIRNSDHPFLHKDDKLEIILSRRGGRTLHSMH